MAICEKCGQQTRIPIRICNANVCRSVRHQVDCFLKVPKNPKSELRQERREVRQKAFNVVKAWVERQPTGREFSAQIALSEVGWSGQSKGDLLRMFLDALTCSGMLKKTQFRAERVGHLYRKERWECPLSAGAKCKCTWKDGDSRTVWLGVQHPGED